VSPLGTLLLEARRDEPQELALFSAGRITMKLHALAVLSLVGLLGADTAKDDAVKKDLKALQGTWTVVSMEMDGKFLPDESRRKIKLTIAGEAFTFDNGEGTHGGIYKVDPTKDPKELDIVITRGDEKGKVYLVSYKFEGGRMIQCMELSNERRPREFTGKAGSGCALEVWQRQQP
jgi:uncharacterized protein (TIGR03067 family)